MTILSNVSLKLFLGISTLVLVLFFNYRKILNMGGNIKMENTRSTIKSYILNEFLPGEDPALLTDSTLLVTGGILDSLATLKLVEFLNQTYQIEIEPYEMSADNLDTLPGIVRLVHSKL